jgi:hypothetical protein
MAQQRLRDSFAHLVQLSRRFNLSKENFFWLWRSGLMGRPATQEGFILPTVTLLLLILSLVVGLLIFRTYNRTEQVSGQRKQKVIYNYATPAIDRAKAKIEYLFTAEALALPPSDDSLTNLLKKGTYNFPGETRLDLDGNPATVDPGWVYEADIDGDDATEKVAYSLLTAANSVELTNPNLPFNAASNPYKPGPAIESPIRFSKARALVTRNGPINLLGSASGAQCQNVTTVKERAWQDVGKVLRKALQVNAVVIGNAQRNGGQVPIATLEMQQDREAPKSPKWGAWFRTDMEITPGPLFRWNGALHTEGNFVLTTNNNLDFHLISSPRSCVFDIEASTITTREREETNPATGAKYTHKGHIISGSIRDNNYTSANVRVMPYSESASNLTDGNFRRIQQDSDSLNQSATTPANQTAAIALDPIVLFNEDRNASRSGTTLPGDINTFWNPLSNGMRGRVTGRIKDDSQPYVDDTFRADNRYGPKPNYKPVDGKGDAISLRTLGKVVGDPIDPNDIPLTLENPTKDKGTGANAWRADIYDETTYGYDGYWERRAKNQGVRIIVGQRLELGNAFGWNGGVAPGSGPNNDQEPLYPPTPTASDTGSFFASRRHEQKQLRTLRDNLAAVQATAIYHYRGNNAIDANEGGNFPVACLATTAHPGTPATIKASTTFRTISSGGADRVDTNFLEGKGTNGWEFAPPGGNEAGFKTALNGDLGRALRNLANFAGDPEGGLPSHKALANARLKRVYPDPIHTMWGDFSMLRRITDANSNLSTAYDDLSPADKSTLHTAACTIQMLGYNIQNVEQSSQLGPIATNRNKLDILDKALSDPIYLEAYSKDPTNPGDVTVEGTDGLVYNYAKDKYDLATAIELEKLVRDTIVKLQIDRDRRYGFKQTPNNVAGSTGYTLRKSARIDLMQYKSSTGRWQSAPFTNTRPINLGFDYVASNYLGLSAPAGRAEEQRFVRIAVGLQRSSPSISKPKYPSLFYLFPTEDHDFDGDTARGNDQPPGEDYIYNGTDASSPKTDGGAFLHGSNTFKAVDLAVGSNAAGTPRSAPTTTNSAPVGWLTPVVGAATNAQTCTTGNACNIITYQPPTPAGGAAPPPRHMRTAFQDKVIYNGREAMAVRLLDMDIDLLRRTGLGGSTDKRDSWLPIPNFTPADTVYQTKTGAVYYVFREDAVREDMIQRDPATNTPLTRLADYMDLTGNFTANYVMRAVGAAPQDPPRSDLGISPKSVDFFADPDRRPHGFRLRNGSDIRRSGLSNNRDDMRGLSLISDNPVYVQGPFNLHTQEEFTTALQADWSNFYSRSDLNPNFACEAGSSTTCTTGDQWRPVEVIADSITLLSSAFRDGSIAQGLLTDRSALTNATRMSFTSATVPLVNNAPADIRWTLEKGSQLPVPPTAVPSPAPTRCEDDASQLWDYYAINPTTASLPAFPCSPVKVDRDNYFVGQGNGAISPVGKDTSFRTVSSAQVGFKRLKEERGDLRGWIVDAATTTYNLTFVSGLVPSRPNSYNGGMHNFPRMLEGWTPGNPLQFSGAMVQLNFSNYATAPFDIDSWEPGTPADGTEALPYYGAPDRRWGYDVALQYAPAGPISQRFLAPRKTRSEFYRDLPVDDPYVRLLRCARASGSGVQVDASASASECTP